MKPFLLLKKDVTRYWVLILTYVLAVLITTSFRTAFWSGNDIFRINNNPHWIIAGFAELSLIFILIPTIMHDDGFGTESSFFGGRPLTSNRVAIQRFIPLLNLGVFFPIFCEAVILTHFGFRYAEIFAALLELFFIRLGAISACCCLAGISSSFVNYCWKALACLIIFCFKAISFLWFLLFVSSKANSIKYNLKNFIALCVSCWFISIAALIILDRKTTNQSPKSISPFNISEITVTPLSQMPPDVFSLLLLDSDITHGQYLDLTSISFNLPNTRPYQREFIWRNGGCLSEEKIFRAFKKADVTVKQSGWIKSCQPRYTSSTAVTKTQATDADISFTLQDITLDYLVPLQKDASTQLQGRNIKVLQPMSATQAGAVIEYAIEPHIHYNYNQPNTERRWTSDDTPMRLYFLVNRKTEEIMQLDAFQFPLEGIDGSYFTPPYSKNRVVRFYPLASQKDEMPPQKWFADAELAVLKISSAGSFNNTVKVNFAAETEKPAEEIRGKQSLKPLSAIDPELLCEERK